MTSINDILLSDELCSMFITFDDFKKTWTEMFKSRPSPDTEEEWLHMWRFSARLAFNTGVALLKSEISPGTDLLLKISNILAENQISVPNENGIECPVCHKKFLTNTMGMVPANDSDNLLYMCYNCIRESRKNTNDSSQEY